MIIDDKEHGQFEVCLVDDGTLDTVLSVALYDGQEIEHETEEVRFSTEYGANYRDDNGAMTDEGFEQLAAEAVESYIEQYLI